MCFYSSPKQKGGPSYQIYNIIDKTGVPDIGHAQTELLCVSIKARHIIRAVKSPHITRAVKVLFRKRSWRGRFYETRAVGEVLHNAGDKSVSKNGRWIVSEYTKRPSVNTRAKRGIFFHPNANCEIGKYSPTCHKVNFENKKSLREVKTPKTSRLAPLKVGFRNFRNRCQNSRPRYHETGA